MRKCCSVVLWEGVHDTEFKHTGHLFRSIFRSNACARGSKGSKIWQKEMSSCDVGPVTISSNPTDNSGMRKSLKHFFPGWAHMVWPLSLMIKTLDVDHPRRDETLPRLLSAAEADSEDTDSWRLSLCGRPNSWSNTSFIEVGSG